MTTVWIVAESRFEWYEIKHVCLSKEVAWQKWEGLRSELIADNQEMVDWCSDNDYDPEPWKQNIIMLQKLNPGDSPESRCDYPDIKELTVTE